MTNLSRREFLRVSSLAAAATVAAACVSTPTAPAEPVSGPAIAQPTAAPVGPPAPTQAPQAEPAVEAEPRFKEAPMLADRVAKGDLPPVEERLPENPFVPVIQESIGKYGGSVRRAFTGVADYIGVGYALGTIGLTTTRPDLSMTAAIAESWEVNGDATVWTWHLRRGARWSDGTPYTSQDFAWFWQYRLGNEVLTPTPPRAYSAGTPLVLSTLSTPDDWTVIMEFPAPKPLLAWDGTFRQNAGVPAPASYSKQFHVDFLDKAVLDKMVADAGFTAWDQLYHDRHNAWYNYPDLPSMRPWHPMGKLSEELFVAERNPYFCQVDPEGQQLPYVDRMVHRMFDALDVFELWILNGEIDFQQRHVDIGSYTLLKEGESQGGYDLVLGVDARSLAFGPNHASNNARLSEFFDTREVRLAMSYAVDRVAMNELALNGLCTPRQYSPLKSSPNYYPPLSDAHLAYDPDKANELLDAAGYTEKDENGFRKYKDGSGETISFVMESYWKPASAGEDAAMMAIQGFADVGIMATYKYIDRSLYNERIAANEMEACWSYWNSRTVLPTVDDNNAGHFTGITNDPCWAGGWRLWRINPTDPNAIEPPADHWVRKIWDIYYNEVAMEPDDAKRNKIFEKLMDVWAEELPIIGYLGELPALTIVRKGLRNHLPGYPNESAFNAEHLQGTHTLYWEDPEAHV